MVRCQDCVLLDVFGKPADRFWNRCVLKNEWNVDIIEERECIDFQPGP
jgi:hypothetical protein